MLKVYNTQMENDEVVAKVQKTTDNDDDLASQLKTINGQN